MRTGNHLVALALLILSWAATILAAPPDNVVNGFVQVLPTGNAIATLDLYTTQKTYDHSLTVTLEYTSGYVYVSLVGDDPKLNPFILPVVTLAKVRGGGIGPNFNYTATVRLSTQRGVREARIAMSGSRGSPGYDLYLRIDVPGNFTEGDLRKAFTEGLSEFRPMRVKVWSGDNSTDWHVDAWYEPVDAASYYGLIRSLLRGFPGTAMLPSGQFLELDFPLNFPGFEGLVGLEDLGGWRISVDYPFVPGSATIRREFEASMPDDKISLAVVNLLHPLQPWAHLISFNPAAHEIITPVGFNTTIVITMNQHHEQVTASNVFYRVGNVMIEGNPYWDHFDRHIFVYTGRYNITFIATKGFYFYLPDAKAAAATIRVTSPQDVPAHVELLPEKELMAKGISVPGSQSGTGGAITGATIQGMYVIVLSVIAIAALAAVVAARVRGGKRSAEKASD